MIYLDHASTTYPYIAVVDAVNEVLTNYWGNPSNNYSFGQKSKRLIEDARKKIADAMHVSPEEIYFTSGSSEGNAWAIKQSRGIALVSQFEHHNLTKNNDTTIIDETYLNNIKKVLNGNNELPKVLLKGLGGKILSHMYVNNETGEVFDVAKMAEIAHAAGMFFHCDMTQAIGNINIDLKGLGVDIATFSGHKIHGPKGIGFNYFNKETFPAEKIKPLIYGGDQESFVRAGTENIAYIVALAEAVSIATKPENVENKRSHTYKLNKEISRILSASDIKYIPITESVASYIPSTYTFCLKDIDTAILADVLSSEDIFIGTGSACNTGDFAPSDVLKAMLIPDDYIKGMVRISMDISNTDEEVEHVINRIISVYKELTM